MSLEHILLGLLREPASGYDLKAIFDERIHYFWAAELSQIYPALQGLERKGLLRSRHATSKRGPGRRMYQITPAGHRVLREWLEKGPEISDERMAYLAKIYLMDELGDPQNPNSLSPQKFHVLLTLRKGVYSLSAHLKWCYESIRRIRERMEKEGLH